MTLSTSSKPNVLLLGPVEYATTKLDQLKQISNVIQCESKNRDEFISDLRGKYSNITNIYRTFDSINFTGLIDSDLIQHFPKSLKTISHGGAGYDAIDALPLSKRGILLSNVTVPVESPTADTAIYLILGTMRQFQIGQKLILNGEWKDYQSLPIGNSPQGHVVGILGMGGIGRGIRDRLAPFGFKKILYYNRSRLSPELEKDSEYVTMDELFQKSDVLVLALPLNKNTRHIINEDSISKMKDGVILVNIARGAIIDEVILPKHLKSGKIKAFGADVFENEPKISPELYNLTNVICLPHLGTNTFEAMENMESWTIENIISHIETGKLKSIVPEQKHLIS
ncbi:unnamed protein product [Candida verbasci]|uniref:2-hydroxyacid dehydrogenase n=1 Tax=Candida verbasci TaxID=1227364 RepID=A0A9W4TYL3_9ASCO|nr:unnamed protein product [Candida verbasci]